MRQEWKALTRASVTWALIHMNHILSLFHVHQRPPRHRQRASRVATQTMQSRSLRPVGHPRPSLLDFACEASPPARLPVTQEHALFTVATSARL